MIDEESIDDESVVWPGYVDFLSTFVFILIIFIGSLLYILSGDISKRILNGMMDPVASDLTAAGVQFQREGTRILIPLTGKVEFATNQVKVGVEQEPFLHQVGQLFVRRGIKRIMVRGLADSQPCISDPFCNWDISARRAQEVLKFYYNCDDCGYDRDIVRKLLILSGEGDTNSASTGEANSGDRRVDIILDFNDKKE